MDKIGRTNERLYKSNLGSFAHDNQVSRIACQRSAGCCRYKDKLDRLLASESAGNLNVDAIRKECCIPGGKCVIGYAGISAQMLYHDGCPLRILQSFTDGRQMEIQSSINSGEYRIEPAINKNHARA